MIKRMDYMESNKKQSSIEWLEQEFVKLEATVGVYSVMYELIDKAKAMHKQEIIDAANKLLYRGTGPGDTAAEQYYNEKYKQ